MEKKINPLVFNRQDTIEHDEEGSRKVPLKFEGLHDHSKCIKASENEIKADHDADLIEIEGDPLEEFEDPMYSKLTDHSECVLLWEDQWEEYDESELSDDLRTLAKKC